MSTYLSRIIEVKVKGKWKMVDWYTPDYSGYKRESKSVKIGNTEYLRNSEFCDNAVSFRDTLGESDLANRGIPDDASKETRKATSSEYYYGKTYLRMCDYSILESETLKRYTKTFRENLFSKEFWKINRKLDKILMGTVVVEINPKKKKKEDEEPGFSIEDEEYLNDLLYDYLAVVSEQTMITAITESCGVYNPEDIRVIYYYS